MSARERDRLKVLHEVRKRHITQKHAGVELGISARWVRTLPKRLRKEGDSAWRRRLRGRPSHRKTPAAVKRECWSCSGRNNRQSCGMIRVNRETLRQWLMEVKLKPEGRPDGCRAGAGIQRADRRMA